MTNDDGADGDHEIIDIMATDFSAAQPVPIVSAPSPDGRSLCSLCTARAVSPIVIAPGHTIVWISCYFAADILDGRERELHAAPIRAARGLDGEGQRARRARSPAGAGLAAAAGSRRHDRIGQRLLRLSSDGRSVS